MFLKRLAILGALSLGFVALNCAEGDSPGEGLAGNSGAAGDATVETLDVSLLEDVNDSSSEGSVVEGGYDTSLDVQAEQGCVEEPPPPANIVVGECSKATDNECDGLSDPPTFSNKKVPNGTTGNGFDDDCDGLVDEGCPCPAVGSVKECFLMPSSWVDDSTLQPVGWCALNSKGTVKCVATSPSPEFPQARWDGVCRGALPPHNDDTCALGDFNCDGVQMNSKAQNCTCVHDPVTCPTEPITTNPFPDRKDLTKRDPNNPLVDSTTPFIVDGWDWIEDGVQANAQDWVWELTGGDCDNVLPHPTFMIFDQADSTTAITLGDQVDTLGPDQHQHGYQTPADSGRHQVFPAFSLSGDYVLKGTFKLDGKERSCSVKVQVRAPGIRAELCWDVVGFLTGYDVDLHFARLQGNPFCDQKHAWFHCGGPPVPTAPNLDDCYFYPDTGCLWETNPGDVSSPGWGYDDSQPSACHGWGSLRPDSSPCTNPRLDRDLQFCQTVLINPNSYDPTTGGFCGPENINLDKPNAGDRFLVGAHCFHCVHPPDQPLPAHPHINIYCNGERVLSSGYDPWKQPDHPALTEKMGGGKGGSFWTAALVKWSGNPDQPCTVETVPSKQPDPVADGDSTNCVENGAQNKGDGAQDCYADPWFLSPNGAIPSTAAEACWH